MVQSSSIGEVGPDRLHRAAERREVGEGGLAGLEEAGFHRQVPPKSPSQPMRAPGEVAVERAGEDRTRRRSRESGARGS